MNTPFKMKGSPIHSGTAAHKSALKDKMDYGPYSYAHNTKKATKDHFGKPHGPKPTPAKSVMMVAGKILKKVVKGGLEMIGGGLESLEKHNNKEK